jgi:hypothetical protein
LCHDKIQQGNDLLPDTGITEQPKIQQPKQEPSNEEQDTEGPLT